MRIPITLGTFLMLSVLGTLCPPSTQAHGSREHPHGPPSPSVWQQVPRVDDLNYLSMVGPSPGSEAGRAYSRLVLADGTLQRSHERSDGTLLSLRTVTVATPGPLLALEWPASPSPQGEDAAPDPTPLVVDFHPALAFSARVHDGRLTDFSAVQASETSAAHHAFAQAFDQCFDSATSRAATPGMYLQAVPYLGTAAPDRTVDERDPALDALLDRPFAFIAVEDTARGACTGDKTLCVQAGQPLIVQAHGVTYAVNAYRLASDTSH